MTPKFSKSAAIQFLNSRPPRQKIMIAALAFLFLLFVDTFVVIRPLIGFFSRIGPQLAEAKRELQNLKQDVQNRELIEKQWKLAIAELAEKEKNFIAPNEVPAMLESLSKLAMDAKVRILSLKPIDAPADSGVYRRVPIKISAMAGTHEFGKFLASLETGQIFFRVTDLEIRDNPTDKRKHLIDLGMDAYRKGLGNNKP